MRATLAASGESFQQKILEFPPTTAQVPLPPSPPHCTISMCRQLEQGHFGVGIHGENGRENLCNLLNQIILIMSI